MMNLKVSTNVLCYETVPGSDSVYFSGVEEGRNICVDTGRNSEMQACLLSVAYRQGYIYHTRYAK
jgi:hypothetical protein